ncbi:MAG TPA: hypothetical protein VFF06_29570 [Polyangia bacterium]|nr:hypothetical protein [Polyangia bacterium]
MKPRGSRWPVAAAALVTAAAIAIVCAYRARPGALGMAGAVACALAALATVRLLARRPSVGLARGLRILLYGVVFYFAGICFQEFSGEAVASWGALALAFVAVALSTVGEGGARAHAIATRVCFALIAIESILQSIAWIHPSRLWVQYGSDAGQYVERIRPKRGQTGAGGVPFNSWGEYDFEPARKRPGECLVVTIGDSFSVGGVPLPYHFTSVAERGVPGCAIYNAGVARIGPREYQYLLKKEALALDPDLIVVDLFLGNDIVDDYGCNPSPLRFWLDRENLLLYTVPRRLFAPPPGAAQAPMPPLDDAAARWPWLIDPTQEAPTLAPDAFYEIEDRHARELCSAEAERYYGDFFQALDELIAAAGKPRLAFMLIPDELQVEDEVWTRVARDTAPLALERDRPQRVVGEWLARRGLPVLDLLPVLRAAAPFSDGKKHFYLLRDTHFNARGNRIAGEALAGFLIKRLRP